MGKDGGKRREQGGKEKAGSGSRLVWGVITISSSMGKAPGFSTIGRPAEKAP